MQKVGLQREVTPVYPKSQFKPLRASTVKSTSTFLKAAISKALSD